MFRDIKIVRKNLRATGQMISAQNVGYPYTIHGMCMKIIVQYNIAYRELLMGPCVLYNSAML